MPPSINDVRVFPGTDPGAEDIFLEFDFEWRGDQNISLLLNPTPKFLQSVPGLSTVVNKLLTWTVSSSTCKNLVFPVIWTPFFAYHLRQTCAYVPSVQAAALISLEEVTGLAS